MGFFNFTERPQSTAKVQGLSLTILHKKECMVCPLNLEKGLAHPHMPAHGAKNPLVYMLGEAPGATEDDKGRPFVGKAGGVLRFRIPEGWDDRNLRWNNVVRTRPRNKSSAREPNREPTYVEIECCRPSIVRDIEAAQPKAIFGFGNIPLNWATQQTGITNWAGRKMPVTIGKHTCWFFPMLHPSGVMRNRKFVPRKKSEYGSEEEFKFSLDLKRAFAAIDELPAPYVHTPEDVFADIEIITGHRGWKDVDAVADFLKAVADDDVVGYDYETKGTRPYQKGAKILSVGVSGAAGTLAFALDHKDAGWTEAQLDAVYHHLREFLINAYCRKAVHNLAFELEWSGYFMGTKTLRSVWGCTMSQAFILDERPNHGNPGTQSLEFLCIQHFGVNIKELTNVNRKDVESEPLEKSLRYNGVDAKYHKLLYLEQRPVIKREGLGPQYAHHLKRIPALVLTQLKGIPVNQKTVERFYGKFTSSLERIEKDVADLDIVQQYQKDNGKRFRPSANRDIGIVIKDYLRVELEKVDEKSLIEIDHPIIDLVLEWRDINKQRSTYVMPLREGSETLFPDGKLHPILSTTSTRTWRTASEDPNSQNFPVREHKEIRSQVEAPPGYKIVSFDYAGIQARNVAMESKDKTLIDAFWDRYDIHEDWMYRITKKYPRWIDIKKLIKGSDEYKTYRYRAKNQLVFPSFFGAQPKKVSSGLGIPVELAAELHEEFWDMFPNVKNWHVALKKQYDKLGYVAGHSGFRRRAPLPPNQMINAPIQADESIIVLDAMIRLSEMQDTRLQPIMEIHDDLTFLWQEREIDELAEIVIDTMLDVPFVWAHIVPIAIEMSLGNDWSDKKPATPVAEFSSDTWKGGFKYVAEDAR